MEDRCLESILLEHGYTEPFDSFSEPLISRIMMDLLRLEQSKAAGIEPSVTSDDTCNDLFEAATSKVANLMSDLQHFKLENELLKSKISKMTHQMDPNKQSLSLKDLNFEKANNLEVLLNDSDAELACLRAENAQLKSRLTFSDSYLEKIAAVNDQLQLNISKLEKLKREIISSKHAVDFMQPLQISVDSLKLGFEPIESLNLIIKDLRSRIKEKEEQLLEAKREASNSTKDLKALIKKLESELATEKIKTGTLESRISSLISDASHIEYNKSQSLSKISEQQNCIKELNESLNSAQKVLIQAKNDQDQLTAIIKSQEEEIKDLKKEVEFLKSGSSKLESELASMQESQQIALRKLEEKSELHRKACIELSNTLRDYEASSKELVDLREKIGTLQDLLDSKKHEKDLLMTTYCRIIQDNEKMGHALRLLKSEGESLKTENSLKDELLQKMKRENEKDDSSFYLLKKELEKAQDELTILQKKMVEMEASQVTLEADKKSLTTEITAANERLARQDKMKLEMQAQLNEKIIKLAELQAKLSLAENTFNSRIQDEVNKVEQENLSVKSQLQLIIEGLEIEVKEKSKELFLNLEKTRQLQSELAECKLTLKKKSEEQRNLMEENAHDSEQLKMAIEELQRKVDILEKEKIGLESNQRTAAAEYKKRIDELTNEIQLITRDRVQDERRFQLLRSELEAKCRQLEENYLQLEKENNDLRQIMQSVDVIMKGSPATGSSF